MIDILSVDFTRGDLPSSPVASEVALEAGATEAQATAMIATAWEQAETFTGRTYYPVTAGQMRVDVRGIGVLRWPRYPAPEAFTFERKSNGAWQEFDVEHEAGLIDVDLPCRETWRITQVGTVEDIMVDEEMRIVGIQLDRIWVEGPVSENRAITREAITDVGNEGAMIIDLNVAERQEMKSV